MLNIVKLVIMEIIRRPANALAWYLKQQNFDKEVYVLGYETLRNDLRSAGLRVVHDEARPCYSHTSYKSPLTSYFFTDSSRGGNSRCYTGKNVIKTKCRGSYCRFRC